MASLTRVKDLCLRLPGTLVIQISVITKPWFQVIGFEVILVVLYVLRAVRKRHCPAARLPVLAEPLHCAPTPRELQTAWLGLQTGWLGDGGSAKGACWRLASGGIGSGWDRIAAVREI